MVVGAGELIERDAELAAIDARLAAAAAGEGSLLLVDGAAGVGKSTLLDAAVERGGTGFERRVTARASELETALSFGVARQLLEGLLEREAAQETGLLPMLLAGQVPAREVDELELVYALYRLVSDLAERGPVLIAVDDVQWSDTPSVRFLLYLVQRLPRLSVAVIATRRLGEHGPGEELLDRLALAPSSHSLRPAPLSLAGTTRLVGSVLGTPDDRFAEASHRVSGGNPFYLRELLSTLTAEGVAPRASAAAQVERMTPEAVLRATLVQMGRLGEGARALARAVAVLGEDAALRRAARMAGLDQGEATRAADSLVGAQLLRRGEPLIFTHPLLRSTVAADLPEGRRALDHRRAADLLAHEGAPAERVAGHLLASPRAGDPWVVDRLLEAARGAAGTGTPDSAVAYLRRALEEPPPLDRRAELLVALGEAEALTGGEEAIERLEEALKLTGDPARRAEVLFRLGSLLYRASRLADARRTFARGVDECPRDHELHEVLRTAWLGLVGLSQEVDVSVFREEAGRPAPVGEPRGRADRERLIQLSLARVFGGEDAVAAREYAERAVGEGTMLRADGVSLTFSIAASCLTWTDGLDAAEREIAMAHEGGRALGSPLLLAYIVFGRSQLRYWQGRMSEAAADAGVAVEAWRGGWSFHLPSAAHWQALALIELDDLDGAETALRIGEESGGGPSNAFYQGFLASGRGRLALARGDAAAAARHYATVAGAAGTTPYLNATASAHWRPWAAIASHGAGDQASARAFVGEELERARRFGTPRGIGRALRAAGIVERDVSLLEQAVETLAESPAVMELARARVDLGSLIRASGRRAQAREPLRAGLDLARRIGAHAIADHARDELEATGARVGREARSGRDALTPSERRVAELAADGRSNPEIADALFVARKTVEWHLQHVYRKLGVSSRTALPDALEDPR